MVVKDPKLGPLSMAQSGSGQGGNRSVPKKEREIHGVDFRMVSWVSQEVGRFARVCDYCLLGSQGP